MRVPSTVLLLLAAVLTGAASAADHDTVVDTTNFQRQVVADEGVWVVKFHSPRCGTCQEFAPVWGKFAGKVGAKARFGVVDIDTKDGMALAKQLSALEDGIPSVRVFKMSADR
jgi:thioredoxin-like negative regulator of GroEL